VGQVWIAAKLTDVASSPVALPPGQTCLVLTGN